MSARTTPKKGRPTPSRKTTVEAAQRRAQAIIDGVGREDWPALRKIIAEKAGGMELAEDRERAVLHWQLVSAAMFEFRAALAGTFIARDDLPLDELRAHVTAACSVFEDET